jgi:hypothetical protein
VVEEEELMQTSDVQVPTLDQLASFDLDSLVSGAVRLRADRAALADSTSESASLTFAELDRRVSALAAFWTDIGLKPGERVLIAGGASASSVVALVATMRAGLDAAMAPLHLSGEEMVDFARDCEAVALAADAAYGELFPAEEMLSVAAQAARVRLVCSLGGGSVDGAVDADPAKLSTAAQHRRAARQSESQILTRAPSGEVLVHRQRTLVAAALDLVTRARIGMRLPIVATLAPSTFAGLVAGPVAALLAGAPLLLHGPFSAAGFSALLRSAGPVHLVAPLALLPALRTASLLGAEALASLVVVSRHDDLCAASSVDPTDSFRLADGREAVPIVDLFAIGEYAAVPEPRARDGSRRVALIEPHYIALDDQRILAAGRGADFAIEGAAVTGGGGRTRASIM